MSNLSEYLPFIIPLVIIEIALAVAALIHVLKHPNYRFGNKVMWIIVVLIFEFIGPIVYFTIGRGDE
ncbi:PLDc N-terminal domain-containing protein [Clostridium neuense]|uniref:PLDc N-terminal domain-containing protein n=1 Tax=Clostridium neuense TaxID=1728934 RepID=A0ABW8TI78_9CLOT